MKKRIIIAVAVLLTASFAIMANNTNIFIIDDANAGCSEVSNGSVVKVCRGIFHLCSGGDTGTATYVCHGKPQ